MYIQSEMDNLPGVGAEKLWVQAHFEVFFLLCLLRFLQCFCAYFDLNYVFLPFLGTFFENSQKSEERTQKS